MISKEKNKPDEADERDNINININISAAHRGMCDDLIHSNIVPKILGTVMNMGLLKF